MAFAVDDTLVRIYHKEAEETLTYSLPEFSKNCLHNTALGKAYLSSLPDHLIAEKIAVMELAAKTNKTIVEKINYYRKFSSQRSEVRHGG